MNTKLTMECTDDENDAAKQKNVSEPSSEPSDIEAVQEEDGPKVIDEIKDASDAAAEGNTLEQRCLDESSGETNYINAVEEEDGGTNRTGDIQDDTQQGRDVAGLPVDTSLAEHKGVGQENEAECEQLLSNMGYNDRVRLSDLLDGNDIEELMRKLLSAQDVLYIWRACHGGHDPAMGLIFTLAQSKLTTLAEFREFASKDDSGKAKRLLDIIDEYPQYSNETLDKLPFDLLAKIASEISANPHPTRERSRPLWKTIASSAKLSPQSIKNLDMPTFRASQHESMTMKFIEIVGQRYPEKKVSWLVKGLLAVNRRDIVGNYKLFVHCREHCCKHLFTTNNPNT